MSFARRHGLLRALGADVDDLRFDELHWAADARRWAAGMLSAR